MKRIIPIVLVLCLVFSSFTVCYAAKKDHDDTCTTKGQPVSSKYYNIDKSKYDCWSHPYWTVKCKECGYKYEYELPQRTHDWDYITIQPWCTHGGGNALKCKECGHIYVYQETAPALGHDFTELRKEPDCVTKGWRQDYCKRCGAYENYEVLPALGHDLKEYKVDDLGISYKICSRCGKYDSGSVENGTALGGTEAKVSRKGGTALGNCTVRANAMSYNPIVPFAALKDEGDTSLAFIPAASITKGVALKPESGKTAQIIIDEDGSRMTLTAGEKDMAVALIDICEIEGNDYIPFAKAIVENGELAELSAGKTDNGDFCLKTEKGTTLAIPGGSASGSGNAFALNGKSAALNYVKLKSKPNMPAIIVNGANGLQFNYIRGATVGSFVSAAPAAVQKSVITF